MAVLRTSLDQWRVLAAVIDAGGFAQAATLLHRSQSAVSYNVAQLQESLGVPLLAMQGRRAELTPAGEALLRRSRSIVTQFAQLEAFAQSIASGWESALSLVVDAAFPQPTLLGILTELDRACPHTTLTLTDAVLSGAEEAIAAGTADVVVTTRVPAGHLGDWLFDVTMVAVAAPTHALHALQRMLTPEDLAQHTQMVVRDSGRLQPRDEGWLGAQRRWTVAALEASHAAVRAGLAYAWLPAHLVADDIAAGKLLRLPLNVGGERRMPLYVVLVKGETAGPAARMALELFQRHRPVVQEHRA